MPTWRCILSKCGASVDQLTANSDDVFVECPRDKREVPVHLSTGALVLLPAFTTGFWVGAACCTNYGPKGRAQSTVEGNLARLSQ